MKHLLLFGSLSFLYACDFFTEKEDEEDEEDEDDGPREEGDTYGDCLDGMDNDEDGYIDCEDQGCDGKPACEDSTDTADTDDLENGTPCIELSPSVINFPDADASAGISYEEIVTVSNCGDGDLHIEDLYLGSSDSPFSVTGISTPLLAPEGEAEFSVTFAPHTAGDFQEFVFIESDAPDTPIAEVQLNGIGLAPIIDVSPSDYDFGSLYVGCEETQTLTISNIGNTELIVSNFNFSTASSDLAFDANESMNGSLPWSISPSSSLDVFVDYAPLDEISDTAFLMITSNDPYVPEVLAEQNGFGEIYAETSDIFEATNMAVDFLFAFDRTCSMSDDVGYFEASFGDFVTHLSNLGADYHVGVVVGDSGCVNPGGTLYIDNTHSASQATTILEQMIDINQQNIAYGSNEERAFTQFEAALDEAIDISGAPDPSGCNYGLIRQNAKLSLIGISDEPEQSFNNYSYYVSMFQGLKANPNDVVIYGIGGDYPSGCGGADAFTGIYEASVATGGQLFSICDTNWTPHLEAIADASISGSDSFVLNDYPVPETITVKVNGVTVTSWSYDASANEILFTGGFSPVSGDEIQVDYALYGECN